jgi:hypothetical protein
VPDLAQAINIGLLVTLMAVFVAGLAAVLGIWMERDKKKPPRYAWALSALIVLATFVSLMQSYLDQREQDELKEDMARLLSTMDKLAHESDDPALKELVKSELTAQSRSNPEVIDKVAQRVSDEGRDPGEVLGRNLDAAEAEKVARKTSVKPKATEHTDDKNKAKEKEAEEAKQGATAPVAPTEVKRPVLTAGPPAEAAAKAGVPMDPAMAARMNAAAAAKTEGTPPADGKAPVPTPVPVGAAAPAKPDAKAAAAAELRKGAAGKRGPAGARKPTPKKPGR